MANHAEATKVVIRYLTDPELGVISDMSEIEAVGHRVVHGGPYFFESCLVTDDVIEKLRLCYPFAPLHTPAHLMGLEGLHGYHAEYTSGSRIRHRISSDDAREAYTYPISADIAEKYSIRRYGAHGTSHRYVSEEMIKLLGKPAEDTKIVTCHIGNGASISAVKGGKCIDTSMGFTPLDGIEMGTRCGSIDPAIVTFIMKNEGFTPDEMDNYMNKVRLPRRNSRLLLRLPRPREVDPRERRAPRRCRKSYLRYGISDSKVHRLIYSCDERS